MKISTSIKNKLEIYSVDPYSGPDESLDEWTHVARNEFGEHTEFLLDLEELVSPDVERSEFASELLSIRGYFEKIRLNMALDSISKLRHEQFMSWIFNAIEPGGEFEIIFRNPDKIILSWISQVANVMNDGFLFKRTRNAKPTTLLEFFEISKGWIGFPTFDDICNEIPDRVYKKKMMTEDIAFQFWLDQKLYSSGVGNPQDSFKSLNSIEYVSWLVLRSRLLVDSSSLSDNLDHCHVRGHRHQSRLMSFNFDEQEDSE